MPAERKMLRAGNLDENEPSRILAPTLVVGPESETGSPVHQFQGLDSSVLVLDDVDDFGHQRSSRELKNSRRAEEFIPVEYNSDSSISSHGDVELSAQKTQCHQGDLEDPNFDLGNVLLAPKKLGQKPCCDV